jgi:hypothetical protein
MQSVNFAMLGIVLAEIRKKNLTGCLNVFNDNQNTRIFLNQGKIWHSYATPKNAEGEVALYQLLGWKSGTITWENNVGVSAVTLSQEQASDFYTTLLIMQERGTLLSPESEPLDAAFFGIQSVSGCTEMDTTFWSGILAANYCPYRDVSATDENYQQLIRAFSTSKRTGVIKVEYHGFEEYHLIECGGLLGSFHFDDSLNCFKTLARTDFNLFNLAGSTMCVFLVPPKTQISTTKEPEPVQAEPLNPISADSNNPYDF